MQTIKQTNEILKYCNFKFQSIIKPVQNSDTGLLSHYVLWENFPIFVYPYSLRITNFSGFFGILILLEANKQE